MSNQTSISKDTACKFFFNHNRRFSSLFNALCFQGKDIIQSDKLIPWQSDETTIIAQGEKLIDTKRYRDTIKKADMNGRYSIIGIESQSYVDYMMALRVPIYDLLNYYNQYQNSLETESQRKLIPTATLVLYVGERRWTGAKSLKEMMKEIPEEMEEYINDWQMIFVDIKDIDTEKIKDEETREMIEGVKELYRIEKGKKMEEIKLSKDAAIVVGAITGNEWLIEEAGQMKGCEKMKMCESMERYTRETLAEGRFEEACRIVIQLLTKKLGELSNVIIEKIKSSTLEKLDLLTISIFEIESEDDILKIIY